MKPIHKFNNGNGATLCHLCKTVITVGLTNDIYCDRCTSERINTEKEFSLLKAKLKRKDLVKANFTYEEYLEQMDKEVHFNSSDLNM
jgi:reverse gyrase